MIELKKLNVTIFQRIEKDFSEFLVNFLDPVTQ